MWLLSHGGLKVAYFCFFSFFIIRYLGSRRVRVEFWRINFLGQKISHSASTDFIGQKSLISGRTDLIGQKKNWGGGRANLSGLFD
jgi:hypothetical protein